MRRLLGPLAFLIVGVAIPGTAWAHPDFVLLDAEGNEVLESTGYEVAPISTMRTCGECHDTAYIAAHSYHVAVGFDEMFDPGSEATSRPWNSSPGMFGRWDLLRYRRLTIPGERTFDLGVSDWIRLFGVRHVGGGPAFLSRTGKPLAELRPSDTVDPETHRFDPKTGRPVIWDWQASGAVEVNCFLATSEIPPTTVVSRRWSGGSSAGPPRRRSSARDSSGSATTGPTHTFAIVSPTTVS